MQLRRLHHVLCADSQRAGRGVDRVRPVPALDGGPLRPGHRAQGPQTNTEERTGMHLK